jgi:4-hydroxy-tetrahydrodipicolinate synthase
VFGAILTAIVTPFKQDGAVDLDAFRRLARHLVENGSDGLVVTGTTGESPTLSDDERFALYEAAVDEVGDRATVLAGTGTYSTAHSVHLTERAHELGVHGFLVVTPYYNKPPQEGMRRHFSAIADAVGHPLILYNVPGRTGVDLKPETVIKLASHPNIQALKEATGELNRVRVLRDACGPDFKLLSGDDETCCEFMLQGGDGVISVTANVAASSMRQLCDAAIAHRRDVAEAIDARLQPLHKKLFCESNPIPVKWAMQRMGLIGPGIRLPLTPLAPQYHATVLEAMTAASVSVAAA